MEREAESLQKAFKLWNGNKYEARKLTVLEKSGIWSLDIKMAKIFRYFECEFGIFYIMLNVNFISCDCLPYSEIAI